MTWRESGGPPVTPPGKKGFGCFVLERVTVNALGEGGLEFNPDGLVWTCIIHPEHLIDGDSAADAPPKQQAAARPRAAAGQLMRARRRETAGGIKRDCPRSSSRSRGLLRA